MSQRRVLAAGLAAVLTAALAGCIQLPTVAPVASSSAPTSAAPSSSEPAPSATPTQTPSEEPEPTAGGLGPFTVDDGAGDTWTYTVSGYELPTQIESGSVPDGMEAVSLLIDATHDDGSASFGTCFEVQVVTESGTYSSLDEASLGVTAVNDTFLQSESFTGGRAIVAVPAGTTSGSFLVISRFGDDVREFPFS